MKCDTCGAEGVRLYRQAHNYSGPNVLACNAHVPEDGRGWWVPARPHPNGGFWGQTSGPLDSVEEWSALPEKDPALPGGFNA